MKPGDPSAKARDGDAMMNSFTVQSAAFEGPLDLLLSMVRRQEFSLAELPLAPIAAQYLAYVQNADELDVNLGMEWIEMAARLIQWKAASLLPVVPGIPHPGEELKRELVLALQSITGPQSWSNPDTTTFCGDPPAGEDVQASLWTLRKKARTLHGTFQSRRTSAESAVWIDFDPISIGEMRSFALAKLETQHPDVWFSSADWLPSEVSRTRQIYLFLALLDLAREGIVRVDDDSAAGSVRICRLTNPAIGRIGQFSEDPA